MKARLKKIMEDTKVLKALTQIKEDAERTVEEQIELCSIPAPSNQEAERAKRFYEMFKEIGYDNVYLDEVNNVIARYRGKGNGPTVLISAHMDTVFDLDVDCTPKIKNGIIYAPGIADDSRGMAEVLTLARVIKEHTILSQGDILFAGTVGEESLGNLRGVRNIFANIDDIDAFISIDGAHPDALTFNALGSCKYRVTYRGTGGHAYRDFGFPNANFALARAVAKIAEIPVPKTPRTVYNVGIIKGGVAINGIPSESVMYADLRSVSVEELEKLRDKVVAAASAACTEENNRWLHPTEKVTVDIECLGERPCGQQPLDAPIVQGAIAAIKLFGGEPRLTPAASTDSNIPISLGIPAVTVGRGGFGKYGHTVNEQYDPTDAHIGPQRTLALALLLTGLSGVSEPIIGKRATAASPF
ncbi:MAG: M20/M25/M40 family metallo-hydrolase [Firmicutes bacterium]|nr:M20/M25/M40 family metallo-hydrolase [Bacillota bacterium]